jgi:hypothetical protein
MIKKRRGSAKAALGQQRSELRRSAKGKRFIGEDNGAEVARAAERAKVVQMQFAARAAAERAEEAAHREQRSTLRAAGRLVVDTTRLAGTLARLPLRMASVAAALPFRFASAMWLRTREA